MNPRIAQAHPAPLMPFPANARLSDAQAMRLRAVEARDAALMAAVRRVLARLSAWRDRQRALADLRALSDRELADIGLTRGALAAALIAPAPVQMAVARPAPRIAANDVAAVRATA